MTPSSSPILPICTILFSFQVPVCVGGCSWSGYLWPTPALGREPKHWMLQDSGILMSIAVAVAIAMRV